MKKYLLLLGTLGIICAGDVFASADADLAGVKSQLSNPRVLHAVVSDPMLSQQLANALAQTAPEQAASAVAYNAEAQDRVLTIVPFTTQLTRCFGRWDMVSHLFDKEVATEGSHVGESVIGNLARFHPDLLIEALRKAGKLPA